MNIENADITADCFSRVIWGKSCSGIYLWHFFIMLRVFVCVEVLRPSQPNGVMSSAVSLPNHTCTGQAKSSKRLTSIVHILSPETDNCLSLISGRERMTVENISWSISMKECCRLCGCKGTDTLGRFSATVYKLFSHPVLLSCTPRPSQNRSTLRGKN